MNACEFQCTHMACPVVNVATAISCEVKLDVKLCMRDDQNQEL